ncbi:MAG: type III secretion system inner membrane ring subunit SctD [Parachlamydiaceae bacterium]|nr:type III secretion system inner membrane ring subunit SctD [Parachlamydiaceae bacterium]
MDDNNLETTMNSEHRDTIFGEEDKDKAALAEINFDLIDAGRWLLKVIAGPNSGAEFSMHSASTYVIGTDPSSCDIVFHDNSVSRQHARITLGAEDGMTIEDLKSRNQTLIDGETVKAKRKLSPNTVITVGTTSFTVYDREGEMHTIISPLLPAIVKVLQKEETVKAEVKEEHDLKEKAINPLPKAEEFNPLTQKISKPVEKTAHAIGAFIVLGIVAGLFAIIGLGTAALFRNEPVVFQGETDQDEKIAQIFTEFPSITPYFNKSTGTLQLMGHVRTQADKTRLIYAVQGLPFVKSTDDSGIIIDEFVWQEINQVLAKNSNWKSISVQSPTAGKFILSGYLQTRSQADQLSEYIAANFPYLDLLEKRITVEEDVVNDANTILTDQGLRDIAIKMANREITLTGGIPLGKEEALDTSLTEINKIPGVRSVKNLTTKVATAESMINISDRYEVTGVSRQGSTYSVVVHGHILTKGDELDSMRIKEITPNAIFLEKDNVQYRIDFSN